MLGPKRNRRSRRAPAQLTEVARETGLEPATSGVTGRRSNQLSYSPAEARPDKPGALPSQGSLRSRPAATGRLELACRQ
jgi:hypothetical protein